MTPAEFELVLNDMTEREFEAFAARLPQDIAELLTYHRSLVRLFCNRDYYEAVRRAVGKKIVAEIYGAK